MSVWDTYEARISARGGSKRAAMRNITIARMTEMMPETLSYKNVLIDDVAQDVSIIDTTEFNEKKIFSMPGEKLVHGGLVDWENSKWLITELNAHDELYQSGIIVRCNQLLRWKDDLGFLKEQWCIVEDGTKYLVGEKTEDMMAIGDARMALTIAKNDDTVKFKVGTRFILGDPDAEEPTAYEITKTNTLYNVFNGRGVYRFILNQVVITHNDDIDGQVADAYGRGFKEDVVDPDTMRETGVYI